MSTMSRGSPWCRDASGTRKSMLFLTIAILFSLSRSVISEKSKKCQCHFITYDQCLEAWKISSPNEITAISQAIKDNLILIDAPDWVNICESATFVHFKRKRKYERCNRMYSRLQERYVKWLTTDM